MAAKVLNLDVIFVIKNITVSRDFIFIGSISTAILLLINVIYVQQNSKKIANSNFI